MHYLYFLIFAQKCIMKIKYKFIYCNYIVYTLFYKSCSQMLQTIIGLKNIQNNRGSQN